MKKIALLVILAIMASVNTGCAGSVQEYRKNPTYNYPPSTNRTIEEARTQREWAQTEKSFAQSEQYRARAAREWQRAEYEESVSNARVAREYSRAARDLAQTIRYFRYAFK